MIISNVVTIVVLLIDHLIQREKNVWFISKNTFVLCVLAAPHHQVDCAEHMRFPSEGLWKDDGCNPNRKRKGRLEVSFVSGVLCWLLSPKSCHVWWPESSCDSVVVKTFLTILNFCSVFHFISLHFLQQKKSTVSIVVLYVLQSVVPLLWAWMHCIRSV